MSLHVSRAEPGRGARRSQWLGWTAPDPSSTHYDAICDAARTVCARTDTDAAELYLWIDFVCIPQANKTLQMLSIGSLAIYAHACRYFVVVAPATTHEDTHKECNMHTYARRGWCRLEQARQ